MDKKIILGLLVIFTVMMGLSSVNAGLFDSLTSGNNNDLNVSDLEIVSKGYSTYDVNCKITPKKDFNYLEMYVIFYDAENAVLEKCSLVWNTNNPAKDQVIKASGFAYVTNQNEKPVRAEVFITDTALDDTPEKALFAENVTMN